MVYNLLNSLNSLMYGPHTLERLYISFLLALFVILNKLIVDIFILCTTQIIYHIANLFSIKTFKPYISLLIKTFLFSMVCMIVYTRTAIQFYNVDIKKKMYKNIFMIILVWAVMIPIEIIYYCANFVIMKMLCSIKKKIL